MPTHRDDLDRLSLSQLKRLTGRHPETIRQRLEGLDPIASDGRTRWYEPRAALERIYRGADLDLNEQRARLAREQADRVAMENAQARGELVEGATVEEWLAALLSTLAQRLDALPSKAAPDVFGAGSIALCEAAIRLHLNEAREALASASWIAPPRRRA